MRRRPSRVELRQEAALWRPKEMSRMPEVRMPAVLNVTPNGHVGCAVSHWTDQARIPSDSGHLSCVNPCTLAAGDVVNERGDNDVVRERPKDRTAAEAARREAEQFRRLAEEAREVRDHHREALETVRQERERLRETAESARMASEEARMAAETARTATEDARVAADAARHAVVDAVRATADALNASLEQMRVVEAMRRTLREIRDVHNLDSN